MSMVAGNVEVALYSISMALRVGVKSAVFPLQPGAGRSSPSPTLRLPLPIRDPCKTTFIAFLSGELYWTYARDHI